MPTFVRTTSGQFEPFHEYRQTSAGAKKAAATRRAKRGASAQASAPAHESASELPAWLTSTQGLHSQADVKDRMMQILGAKPAPARRSRKSRNRAAFYQSLKALGIDKF